MSEFYIPSGYGLDSGLKTSASSQALSAILGYTAATEKNIHRSGFYIAAIGSDVYLTGMAFGASVTPTVSSSDYRLKIPQGNGATVIVAKRSNDFSVTSSGSFAVQEIL